LELAPSPTFSIVLIGAEGTDLSSLTEGLNRRFQFDESSSTSIRTRNETLSVVAMCVCNPDRSPVGINR
jgi:hypothetical protein